MNKPSLLKMSLRSFVLYAIDMACAVAAWVYGFGMTVQNWWVVIGLMLVARWVFYVSQGAIMWEQARKQAAKDKP